MQFSLFGAAAATQTVGDLDGILLAGGRWARAAGRARLSVVVDSLWRAEALAETFGELGLADDAAVTTATLGVSVRTAFADELLVYAERWVRGSREAPPSDLALTGTGLRLWAIAAGHRDDVGYLLATADPDGDTHRQAGVQLARLGVTAGSVAARGHPGWRVTSVRRLRRLGELLGPPPRGGERSWPLMARH